MFLWLFFILLPYYIYQNRVVKSCPVVLVKIVKSSRKGTWLKLRLEHSIPLGNPFVHEAKCTRRHCICGSSFLELHLARCNSIPPVHEAECTAEGLHWHEAKCIGQDFVITVIYWRLCGNPCVHEAKCTRRHCICGFSFLELHLARCDSMPPVHEAKCTA